VTPRGFYVSTDDIFDDSKWSEPVFFDMLGIDQDVRPSNYDHTNATPGLTLHSLATLQLFFDDKDDKVYLSTTARIYDPALPRYGFDTGVFISEVDLSTGRIEHRPKFLRQSPIGIGIAEGSHIFKKDGVYYLITAEGGTESLHQQWVFRSTEGPYGPWEAGPEGTVNPLVFQGKFPDEEVQYTGHMDIVDSPDGDGRWWAVMLGVREQREGPKKEGGEVIWSQLGRETFLCPVEWEEGWPVVNRREPVRVDGVEGTGLERVEEAVEWRDEFDQEGELQGFSIGVDRWS
jgi:beta-xylosidase